MTDASQHIPGWPAHRFGFGVFQMQVNDKPVLIYAGRTERDAERFTSFEAGRVVFRFKGDVLAACQQSDVHVCDATPDQVALWTEAFIMAAHAGAATINDPAGFAMTPNATPNRMAAPPPT